MEGGRLRANHSTPQMSCCSGGKKAEALQLIKLDHIDTLDHISVQRTSCFNHTLEMFASYFTLLQMVVPQETFMIPLCSQ